MKTRRILEWMVAGALAVSGCSTTNINDDWAYRDSHAQRRTATFRNAEHNNSTYESFEYDWVPYERRVKRKTVIVNNPVIITGPLIVRPQCHEHEYNHHDEEQCEPSDYQCKWRLE